MEPRRAKQKYNSDASVMRSFLRCAFVLAPARSYSPMNFASKSFHPLASIRRHKNLGIADLGRSVVALILVLMRSEMSAHLPNSFLVSHTHTTVFLTRSVSSVDKHLVSVSAEALTKESIRSCISFYRALCLSLGRSTSSNLDSDSCVL